jgi:hypothetical protein
VASCNSTAGYCNIQTVITYYEAQATIRYYGRLPEHVEQGERYVTGTLPFGVRASDFLASDPFPAFSETPIELGRWREPPHLFLANMPLEIADLGPTYKFTTRYGFLAGHVDVAGGSFVVDVPKIAGFQNLIRKAWAGDETTIGELERDLAPEIRLSVRAKEIEIGVGDLWTLTRLLFLRDCGAKKTRVCANPDCPAPYFLQTRKGQKFCTHRCAVLVNVRRFRAGLAVGRTKKKSRRAK